MDIAQEYADLFLKLHNPQYRDEATRISARLTKLQDAYGLLLGNTLLDHSDVNVRFGAANCYLRAISSGGSRMDDVQLKDIRHQLLGWLVACIARGEKEVIIGKLLSALAEISLHDKLGTECIKQVALCINDNTVVDQDLLRARPDLAAIFAGTSDFRVLRLTIMFTKELPERLLKGQTIGNEALSPRQRTTRHSGDAAAVMRYIFEQHIPEDHLVQRTVPTLAHSDLMNEAVDCYLAWLSLVESDSRVSRFPEQIKGK